MLKVKQSFQQRSQRRPRRWFPLVIAAGDGGMSRARFGTKRLCASPVQEVLTTAAILVSQNKVETPQVILHKAQIDLFRLLMAERGSKLTFFVLSKVDLVSQIPSRESEIRGRGWLISWTETTNAHPYTSLLTLQRHNERPLILAY